MKKAYLNWSSGKDAALALYKALQNKNIGIGKLVTTVNTEVDRISMHGLRKELLLQQVENIGLPLQLIPLHGAVSMQEYNAAMKEATAALIAEGFTHSIFGDIFLEDLRVYRDEQLKLAELEGIYPLWKQNSVGLMEEFLKLGFKAITVCTNSRLLDSSFCGRIIDADFLKELPEGVDLCGENGEFHTFVYDGPIFKKPVEFTVGEKVERTYTARNSKEENCFKDEAEESWDTGFCYCDLIPNKQ
ncbi:ATP-binding protein [Zunongwangia sp. F363]|uniref:ATP-binding protein n=1 Tax=Autumnicola tepida TaxID=3075595 RepID=A0ABU3CD87_9FLAO|nr:ATP-binding protein [Zunongwangia sp. F363]MDT0644303.1 ATP-binding protein [Zunongwangia sp. F363]